jgi:hypothetical protein
VSARLIASTKTSFFILCICFYFCQAEIFNKDVIANPITGEGPEVAAKKTLAAAAAGVEEVPICMSLFFLVQCVSIAVAQRPPSLFPPSSLPLPSLFPPSSLPLPSLFCRGLPGAIAKYVCMQYVCCVCLLLQDLILSCGLCGGGALRCQWIATCHGAPTEILSALNFVTTIVVSVGC